MPLNPRSGRPRQRAVDAYRAHAERLDLPCHLCGQPIDYSLPDRHRHPLRVTVDEVHPISRGGSATDPRNFAAAHACCNSSRGDRLITPEVRARCHATWSRHTRTRRRSAAW